MNLSRHQLESLRAAPSISPMPSGTLTEEQREYWKTAIWCGFANGDCVSISRKTFDVLCEMALASIKDDEQ